MIKCKLTQDEIMKRMNQKMVNIVTAYNKGDMDELQAECVSSICSGEEFYDDSNEIKFSNDDELEFTVDGHKFWCDVCVGYGLSSKDRAINTAERWNNGESLVNSQTSMLSGVSINLKTTTVVLQNMHLLTGTGEHKTTWNLEQ